MARVACAALPLSPQRGEGRGEGCEWPIAFNSAGRPHSFEPNPSGIGHSCPQQLANCVTLRLAGASCTEHVAADRDVDRDVRAYLTVRWQAEFNMRATVR